MVRIMKKTVVNLGMLALIVIMLMKYGAHIQEVAYMWATTPHLVMSSLPVR